MSTAVVFVAIFLVVSLATLLLPAKYKEAVLRAPLSLFGGMLKWGVIMLGLAAVVIIAAHVAQIFLPP